MSYHHVFRKTGTQLAPVERDLSEADARARVAAGASCVLRTDKPFDAAWEDYCQQVIAHTKAGEGMFGIPPLHEQLPQVWENVTDQLRS